MIVFHVLFFFFAFHITSLLYEYSKYENPRIEERLRLSMFAWLLILPAALISIFIFDSISSLNAEDLKDKQAHKTTASSEEYNTKVSSIDKITVEDEF